MKRRSKGEEKVYKILKTNRISFKEEYIFNQLRGLHAPLRFDFAVFKNGRIFSLIEIDGKQHFQYVPFFHKTKAGFRKEIMLDRKKNSFCLMNGIPLIRIPYWDNDNLTLQKIFGTPEYIVRNARHNDALMEVK